LAIIPGREHLKQLQRVADFGHNLTFATVNLAKSGAQILRRYPWGGRANETGYLCACVIL
jgi:hypothetical protein